MRTTRRSEGLLFLLALAAAAATRADDEPQKWLARMNRALLSRNYDGVFQHWQGSRVETLRIIHRYQDGAVTERLVSLDGSGREFIRRGTELVCYLPDERTVLVERQPRPNLLLGGMPTFDAAASKFYDIKGVHRTRILGRPAEFIAVDPKDEYRYGYRLWIDQASGMPLKTQLCDHHGQVLEQVIFASLLTPAHISDAALRPAVSTTGFQVLHEESAPATATGEASVWSAPNLPPGFHITLRAAQVMPGSSAPAAHLIFSDGVTSVSVFVQPVQGSGGHPLEGSAQFGSSSAFSTVVEGHQVTAVGEVPPRTVRLIVDGVKAQPHQDPESPGRAAPGAPLAAPVAGPAPQTPSRGVSLLPQH